MFPKGIEHILHIAVNHLSWFPRHIPEPTSATFSGGGEGGRGGVLQPDELRLRDSLHSSRAMPLRITAPRHQSSTPSTPVHPSTPAHPLHPHHSSRESYPKGTFIPMSWRCFIRKKQVLGILAYNTSCNVYLHGRPTPLPSSRPSISSPHNWTPHASSLFTSSPHTQTQTRTRHTGAQRNHSGAQRLLWCIFYSDILLICL